VRVKDCLANWTLVSSSDASNLKNTTARIEGNKVIVNGHKWWISGAGDPRCSLHVLVAMTDPNNESKHKRHTIFFVDPKLPGVEIVRPMKVFGYDDAPEGHCEVIYKDVVLSLDDVAGGPANIGRGFEMLQARLGPGRLHHCMRAIGVANRALDLMLLRITNPIRKTFGKQLKDHGSVIADVAKSRAEIDMGRMIVLTAAKQIDLHKAKGALKEIGIAKVRTKCSKSPHCTVQRMLCICKPATKVAACGMVFTMAAFHWPGGLDTANRMWERSRSPFRIVVTPLSGRRC
jgi:acyl-CoA dehydrogenase